MDKEYCCESCGSIFQVHPVDNCLDDHIVCCPYCMSMEIHDEEHDEDEHDNPDEEED